CRLPGDTAHPPGPHLRPACRGLRRPAPLGRRRHARCKASGRGDSEGIAARKTSPRPPGESVMKTTSKNVLLACAVALAAGAFAMPASARTTPAILGRAWLTSENACF